MKAKIIQPAVTPACGFGCGHAHHAHHAPHGLTGRVTRRDMLRVGAVGAAAAGLTGCITTNRATGRSTMTGLTSLEDDIKIGQSEHANLVKSFGGEYDDPRLQSYISKIGATLAQRAEYQEFTYRFTIVNSWIVNAFALPGGYCYVSRGLIALASNEAELAGVIAHEIGHVNARHTAQRIAQTQLTQGLLTAAVILTGQNAVGQVGGQIAGSVLKSFSREQEMEADALGIRYMSEAGYEPDAMVGFLDTMRDQSQIQAEMNGLPAGSVDETNVNSTHPRTIERVQQARVLAANFDAPDQVINRARYLENVNGMLYGDDPKQGIVQGRAFIHPDLRFRFQVPDGFVINNGTTEVVAQRPNVKAAIVFDEAERKSGDVYSYLTREWGDGNRLTDLGRIDINGIPAATGATRIDGMDYRVVAIQGDGNRVFRFRFISDPSITGSLQKEFRVTTYSFRRLSTKEASRIQPNRIIVVPITPGDSVASLSRGFPEGNFSQASFRVINDLKPQQALPKSGQVKVVVGGAGA